MTYPDSIAAKFSAAGHGPLLAVIPAWNEEATVGEVISRLQKTVGCDIIVVDDASTDRTAEIARKAGALVLTLVTRLGAWGAMQAGLRYGLRHGYRCAVTLDSDGQHLPETIPEMLDSVLNNQAEAVIGACPQRGSTARHIAWAFFRTITGLRYEDLTSGLRIYGYRAMKLLASRQATILDYQDLGVLMLLRKANIRVTEVPVMMKQRQTGKSRIFNSWFTVFFYMLHSFILCIAKAEKHVEIIHE
ncbi:MAG: glycosyltransferase family 2 protein [Desulfobulbaceae bacterium]|nr:glycosyltransferase family 2 protein [Desulfobulbaceae bacterium]